MARADGLYSRVIAWLKILLPLAALALLSTLFLLSDSREPLENVPFADALKAGETARQGVSTPYYTGTTQGGDLVTMTAQRAWPMPNGDISAAQLSSRMQLKDGSTIHLDAKDALMTEADRRLHLSGGVEIESSLGYVLQTDALVSEMDRVAAESLGPVSGHGPLGTLNAGQMQIASAGEAGEVQIVFTGGVKLIYQPPEKEKDQ